MREVPIGLCSFGFCGGACECVDGTDSEGESLPPTLVYQCFFVVIVVWVHSIVAEHVS
jgi:hypothetical protein